MAQQQQQPKAAPPPLQQAPIVKSIPIELYVSCKNLKNLDVLSKSDPICFLYEYPPYANSQPFKLGFTETVYNNLNPVFTKALKIDYYFERHQLLRFEILDNDGNDKYDFVGAFEVPLAQLLWNGANAAAQSQPVGVKDVDLLNKQRKKAGTISIIAQEVKKIAQPWGAYGSALTEDEQNWIKSISAAAYSAPPPNAMAGRQIVDQITFLLMRIPPTLPSFMPVISMNCSAKNLDKKDLFGKSDPYFIIEKIVQADAGVQVHKSNIVKINLNPTWEPISKYKLEEFCGNDLDKKLRFTVYDWDMLSAHDLIGSFTTSVSELIAKSNNGALPNITFPLINSKYVSSKKGYQNSGIFSFDKLAFEQVPVQVTNPEHKSVSDVLRMVWQHVENLERAEAGYWVQQYKPLVSPFSFVDYLAGGVELSLMVAIDFTGSNGDPSQPSSLHYNNGKTRNEYASAICAVGNILKYYDSDQLFSGFGFGGMNKYDQQTYHCFALGTSNANNFKEFQGIEGLLQAYYSTFQHYALSGPTKFSPLLNRVCQLVQNKCSQSSQKYTVLLILTDGVIDDVKDTISALVRASTLPLSIVIVGVGGANFSSMDVLDSDQKPLIAPADRSVSQRDLVQFVPFRQFASNPAMLAEVTLREIPMQMVKYMRMKGIYPNPRPVMMPQVQPQQQGAMPPIVQ